jgi:uncharacterized membrane protein
LNRSKTVTKIPAVVPPLPTGRVWSRNLPAGQAFEWLAAGWRDLVTQPLPSLAYGLAVFLVSAGIVYGLFALEWDYVLFPALAGFLVVGPFLAVGLYEKSRLLARHERVTLARMLAVKAGSGGQILFIGAVLCGLMLLWMRAAVLLYALVFGVRPFPGLDHVAGMLVTTPVGLTLLVIGSVVGGLFAALSFAVSVFSIPMLLDEDCDAFTAMGISAVLVAKNLPVMLVWGAVVLALFLVALVTGLAGLIVIFPLVGHATWHAYKAIRQGE